MQTNFYELSKVYSIFSTLHNICVTVQRPYSYSTMHSVFFHEHKDIFIDLGIRNNFNLPKLHATRYYYYMIMMLGTTNNYNTEYTERLHIDYAKDAYRATNHKDEFAQMTRWLERKEKILRHDKYVIWRLAGDVESEPHHSRPPDMTFRRLQTMPKHPTAKAVTIDRLVDDYGATFFREALARYITQLRHAKDPNPLHERALEILARDIHFPFRTLPVFHRIKWVSVDATVTLDSVHARPQRISGSGLLPRRSDTVLVNLGANTEAVSAGIEGKSATSIHKDNGDSQLTGSSIPRWSSASRFLTTFKISPAPLSTNSPGS